MSTINDIEEIINRETKAWNEKDVNLLLSIFHPDMVWVWPKGPEAHDPVDWKIAYGKFDLERWSYIYADMFATFDIVHNDRNIIKIEVSKEEDGAFAVVDIDTLWKNKLTGNEMLWKGRTSKTYVKTSIGWKMIAHTGVLNYNFLLSNE